MVPENQGEDDGEEQPRAIEGEDEPTNVYITAVQNDQGIDPNEQNDENGEIDIFKMYSKEEIENFRCIFDMFDKEQTGFVDINDL